MEANQRAQDDMRALIDQSTTRLVERANEGLRGFSDRLRNKDLDEIMRDAESFARRQPALMLGAAALAGFLAVRFLKASNPGSNPQRNDPYDRS